VTEGHETEQIFHLRDNNCIDFAVTFQNSQYITTSVIRHSLLHTI